GGLVEVERRALCVSRGSGATVSTGSDVVSGSTVPAISSINGVSAVGSGGAGCASLAASAAPASLAASTSPASSAGGGATGSVTSSTADSAWPSRNSEVTEYRATRVKMIASENKPASKGTRNPVRRAGSGRALTLTGASASSMSS